MTLLNTIVTYGSLFVENKINGTGTMHGGRQFN